MFCYTYITVFEVYQRFLNFFETSTRVYTNTTCNNTDFTHPNFAVNDKIFLPDFDFKSKTEE